MILGETKQKIDKHLDSSELDLKMLYETYILNLKLNLKMVITRNLHLEHIVHI